MRFTLIALLAWLLLSACKKTDPIIIKHNHYIKERRNYFLKCDLNFRSNPQNDGPPSGFEFDFIVWNQEPVYTLAEIKNIKLMSVKTTPTHSRIKIDLSPPVKFDLTLNNGKWLIDDIRDSAPDE